MHDLFRPAALNPAEAGELSQLALELLGDLVRRDTTNPPGNEITAARYLAGRLTAEGIAGEIVEPAPGRGNVVARLGTQPGGDDDEPPDLLLLSHLDVVPAEPAHWTAPPFAGEVRDGFIWGRGTIDTKGLTAVQAAVMIWARRRRLTLRRGITLAATADEECGGEHGVRYLAAHRPELLRGAAALNEGGGQGVQLAGGVVHTVQTAEKAQCPVTVIARGQPGHAAAPTGDNAVVQLSRALVAIGSRRLPARITATFAEFVAVLAAALGPDQDDLVKQLLDPGRADAAIAGLAADDALAAAWGAMIRDTATPTVVEAGYKINFVPGQATAQVDCRLLPGSTPAGLIGQLKRILAECGLGDAVELRAGTPTAPAAASPFDHPLVSHIAAAVRRHAAGAPIAPIIVPGSTDGRYIRPLGTPVYGFMPMLPGEGFGLAHAHDERLSLAGLGFAVKVMWDVVTSYCSVD